jgi:LacI family transcriptional regulator
MEDAGKKATMAGVASALGLSIGTVDRALHNRPGVNAATRAKVLQMVRTMGYRPNPAARALASKRQIRVAAILPRDPGGFFAGVGEGIREAARAVEGTGVTVESQECPWLKADEAELIQAAVDDGVSGIIIAPGMPGALRGVIRKASRRHIPVVCVATDAPGTERLCVIRADPTVVGATAAELLGRVLWGKGTAAVITGSVQTTTHAEILRGFESALATHFPEMRCVPPIEAHDDEDEAYRAALNVLVADGGIAALFVSTSNSVAVLRAVDELGLAGRIVVVTMDLFPAIAARIADGTVLASIYQRPRNQGRQAFRALHRFLVEGVRPPARIGFSPHVVLRSNLKLFVGG